MPGDAASPLVSVIIPVWDHGAWLGECLDGLSAQTYPRDRLEVIIVDNGPSEEVRARVDHHPAVRFVVETESGAYRARNRGIQVARGEVLAFTDADCIPSPQWLEEGVRGLGVADRVGVVAGMVEVVPRDPERLSLAERYELSLGFPQEDFVRRSHFGATCNLFTTAEVMRAVGPFDGRLRSAGDLEWGRRVHASGRQTVFVPEARVRHRARTTIGQLIHRARRVAAGVLLVERVRPWRTVRDQLLLILPQPRQIRRILTSPYGNGAATRMLMVLLYLSLRQVKFWERARVALGGQPLR